MKTTNKGFTLIELLVVVAIIGILAAVVLTSLGSARTKAKDAAAMAQMSSMRAEAELNVTSSGYPTGVGGLCTTAIATTDKLYALRTGVNSQVPAANAVDCPSNTATAWAAGVVLNNGTYYCVDSTGFSGASTDGNIGAADFTC